jgi:peptidoglycan hydrolase-like protein with peptidoglycan-binding domain
MRVGVAFAILVAGMLPALGQEPAAKRPALPSPVATYAGMPLSERVAIQSDLLWAGHYDGVADGEFTERSIAAIRAFQNTNRTKQTGILNPQEREVLAAAAKKEREAVGWTVVEDAPSGARVGFPGKLLPQWVQNELGSRWSSERGEAVVETFRVSEPGASLAAVFEQQKKEPERKVETSQLRGDSFVMTGLQGLKKFYARAEYKNGEVRGLTVLYDQAMQGTMAKIADAVRSTFVPFSRTETAPVKAAQAKGKVEYGTGLVVSTAGHIVTPRHIIDGCEVLVVAGLGNAEIVAHDHVKGLALLRVYGSRHLVPLPLAGEAASGPELTLIGIADPKAQAGGSAASTARAKLGAASADSGLRAIDNMPAPGFAGAAAFDGGSRLAGIVQFRPQVFAEAGAGKLPPPAAVISAETIRDFLAAQGVQPVAGSPAINEAKASVVRVICVRK